MIVDTSALLSALFPDQRRHSECAEALTAASRRVLSPFVLAEADYLVQRAAGITAELALLGEVSRGVFELAPIGEDDVAAAAAVVDQYADLGLGLTDASLVVLAHRYRIHDVFTLDERHFRVVKSLDGRPFRLLPADA